MHGARVGGGEREQASRGGAVPDTRRPIERCGCDGGVGVGGEGDHTTLTAAGTHMPLGGPCRRRRRAGSRRGAPRGAGPHTPPPRPRCGDTCPHPRSAGPCRWGNTAGRTRRSHGRAEGGEASSWLHRRPARFRPHTRPRRRLPQYLPRVGWTEGGSGAVTGPRRARCRTSSSLRGRCRDAHCTRRSEPPGWPSMRI